MMTTHNTKKIAIMGGTFDPIHMGHLVTAEAVRHEFDIDEVIFVPTGTPPHKSSVSITSSEHRYLMTVLATAGNPQFNVSRIEIDRIGTTYTVDTIKELSKLYGLNVKLYFITGADAIHEILTWKNSDELLKLCTFVAVTRPGYKKAELAEQVERLRAEYKSSIHFLEVPALAISSSDIRERVQKCSPIKYLVTTPVENYINKHKLYAQSLSFDKERIKKLTYYVKSRLSEKRYEHTRGVVQMAVELANIHGENKDKIFIAALFHDVAKEMSVEESFEICEKYQVPMDHFEKQHMDLLHGKVGAIILEKQWGIQDEVILDSIKYHTIGRPHMSNIEKIIYLADMIERNRKPYPGIEKIRRLARMDLNKAMYEALLSSKNYVTHILNKEVHPMTEVLIQEYKVYDI